MSKKTTFFLLLLTMLLGGPVTLWADDDAQNDRHGKVLAVDKVKGDFSIMVLGSGGPVATPQGRASAGYLIFIDGTPRILMDAGGGTYQRLAASGVDAKDLDVILLSHLHIDHMGDMSPIIKTVYFHNRRYNLANPGTFPPGRTTPFKIFGPRTNGVPFPPVLTEADPSVPQYPDTTEFVHDHYKLNEGNEHYLHIFTRAISAGIFGYQAEDIPANWTTNTITEKTIADIDGLTIKAIGVNHGPVPALAYRVEYKGKSIVFSGDTSSRSTLVDGTPLANGGNMVEISANADLLIYDTAIMDNEPSGPNDAVFFALHTTPSRIGEVASAANVKMLLLSHLTAVTQDRIPEVKKLVREQGYNGKIDAAQDLQVINLLHGGDHDD